MPARRHRQLDVLWLVQEFLEAGKKRLAGDTARAATADEVQDLRREAGALKEVVADLVLENAPAEKKYDRGWGRRGMRYPASEKLEIIRLVEQSHLPVRATLDKLGVTRRRSTGGTTLSSVAASRHWRIARPDQPGLEPVARPRFAIRSSLSHWRSQSSAHASWRCASPTSGATSSRKRPSTAAQGQDLITSPDLHRDQSRQRVPGQDHRTQPTLADGLHLSEVIGWGWYYLSTVLDDFSRFIVAGSCARRCRSADVTATLDLALAAAGLDHVQVAHRPRLLSDNGSSYVAGDLATWLGSRA